MNNYLRYAAFFVLCGTFTGCTTVDQTELQDPGQEKVVETVVEESEQDHKWLMLNTQSALTTPSRLTDVDFWNDSLGVAVGTGGMFLTLDSGLTWSRVDVPDEVRRGNRLMKVTWSSVIMTRPDEIIVAGFSGVGSARQLEIWKSRTLGKKWVSIHSSMLNFRDRVRLTNSVLDEFGEQQLSGVTQSEKFLMADSLLDKINPPLRLVEGMPGEIWFLSGINKSMVSRNFGKKWAGISWQNKFVPADMSFPGDVQFGSGVIAYAVGADTKGGVALKSDDNGASWKKLMLPTGTPNLLSCHFITSRRGLVAGEEGAVLITEDGGKSWIDRSVDDSAPITDIRVTAIGVGWAAIGEKSHLEDSSLFFTRDFGKSWSGELSGHKQLSRLFVDRPGRVLGVGHVPQSNSDLIVIHESVPKKSFIDAVKSSTFSDSDVVLDQEADSDALVVKNAEQANPKTVKEEPKSGKKTPEMKAPAQEKTTAAEEAEAVSKQVLEMQKKEKAMSSVEQKKDTPEVIELEPEKGFWSRLFGWFTIPDQSEVHEKSP